MKTRLLLILLCTVVLINISCNRKTPEKKSDQLTGTISVSGAFALYPLAVQWAENFKKLYPGVTIDISAGGAGKGMADVLSGMVDLAMFSRAVTPDEEAKGAWKIPVAKDAVFPTVNAKNPVIDKIKEKGLKKDDFKQLFTVKNNKNWNNFLAVKSNVQVHVYTRSDACGAASEWANYFEEQQEDLIGTGVYGDPGIADAVKNDQFGIGYNNLIYIYDLQTKKCIEGLSIIPIDINENGKIDEDENFYGTMDQAVKAIREGKYPAPPARDLYLISKGKPENKLVIEFLKYILSDGQNDIPGAGYVQVDSIKIADARALLQ